MKGKNESKISSYLKNSQFSSYSGIILVIIVVSIFMSFRSENFMTANNILNILRQISVYGILAWRHGVCHDDRGHRSDGRFCRGRVRCDYGALVTQDIVGLVPR